MKLFGSSFSHAAFAHHVGKVTASAAQRIQPIDEPEQPVPCFVCWAIVGFAGLYVLICMFRLLIHGV